MQHSTSSIVISGGAIISGYAQTLSSLIEKLANGESANSSPWFQHQRDLENFRLDFNPAYIPHDWGKLTHFKRIEKVIGSALVSANLEESILSQDNPERVGVYLIGNGVRPNNTDFMAYQDRNDEEDLLFFPKIKTLHAKNYAQDGLINDLVNRYKLANSPISIYCASNSSMSAVHLASKLLRSQQLDRVLIVGWMDILAQDIVFMTGQGMLGEGQSQPFSLIGNIPSTNTCLPADNCVAMMLESREHAIKRGVKNATVINSTAFRQSSGARGGGSFNADFRTIAETISEAMQDAGVLPEEIEAVFLHGNGVLASDKAEAMALQKIWGKSGLPAVSYKGQFGYWIPCSGLLDLMLVDDALTHKRLLAATTALPMDPNFHLNFYTNRPALTLTNGYLLKLGIGVDGSACSAILRYQENLHSA